MYLTYTICSNYHNTTVVTYCVHNLHNMLALSLFYRGSIVCTLSSQCGLIIIRANFAGKVHNMLPQEHDDIWSIL